MEQGYERGGDGGIRLGMEQGYERGIFLQKNSPKPPQKPLKNWDKF